MANYMTPKGGTVQIPQDGSEDELNYLSGKRSMLSNPGTRIHQVYYSAMNTTVDAIQVTYSTGRFKASLSQLSFASMSQIIIPNDSLLEECYLHLSLPPLKENQTLARGWGWGAIASINYLIGSTNIAQVTINGQSIWQRIASSCETKEKRSSMFRMGGETLIGKQGPGGAIGAIPTADLLLPFPWSNPTGGNFAKLPFDTALLSNPIQIQIQFNNAVNIYGGTAAAEAGFTSAILYTRQGTLASRNQGLRTIMYKNPDLMYAYPLVHSQSFTPQSFTTGNGPLAPTVITLLGFINADLLGISFGVVKNSDLSKTNTTTPQPFKYVDLANIMLDFNGMVFYDAPGRSYRLFNTQSMIGASGFENDLLVDNTTDPTALDTDFPFISFSRLRQLSFEGQYQNVWEIGTNVLTLRFEGLEPNTSYSLYATYYYNGIVELQAGQSTLYFN